MGLKPEVFTDKIQTVAMDVAHALDVAGAQEAHGTCRNDDVGVT
jgi:hypothetical protein